MGKLSKRLLSIITVTTVIIGMGLPSIAKADTTIQDKGAAQTSLSAGTLNLLPSIPEKVEATSATDYGLTKKSKDGVMLQAFCWSFNTIKDNMADIAAAGYSTVQTSPANECEKSHPGMKLQGNINNKDDGNDGAWWWQYKPTDWKIGNYQLGTRDDFKAMCTEAHKYGVKIIVDVIPNHTTPELGLVAQSLKDAAGGQEALYHANGFNEIDDYNDRTKCTTGRMGGLPDVNTENKGFQKYFMEYINDTIACGGDGFRYDTAKHIGIPSDPKDSKSQENDFWPVATGKKEVDGIKLNDNGNLFIYGEVLQDRNVPYAEYAKYMSLTASEYGNIIRGAIGNKDFSVGNISNWKCDTADSMVTWVESHDTYYNYKVSAGMTDWQIRMAWAVVSSRSQGTPLFFSRPDGSGNGSWCGKNVLGAKGNDMFKDPEIVGVNKFHNAMVGQPEYLRNQDGGQCLLVERGSKGVCIINLGGDIQINSDTKLANGTYKDQVSGSSFTVSNGKLSGKVAGGKVAVVYNAGDTPEKPDPIKPDPIKPDPIKPDPIKPDPVPVEPTGKNVVYMKQSVGWADAYAYIYDEGTKGVQNGVWPGVQMTKLSDGLYSCEVPTGYTKPTVIFSDGKTGGSRSTPDKAPGLSLDGTMIYDGTNLTKYEPPIKPIPDPVKPDPVKPDPVKPDPVKPDPVKPDPVKPDPVKPDPVKPIPDPVKPDPIKPTPDPIKPTPQPEVPVVTASLSFDVNSKQVVGKEINMTASVSSENSEYEYRFEAISGNGKKIIKDFSSDNFATWETSSEGDYSVFVEVRDKNKNVITSDKYKFTITASSDVNPATDDIDVPDIPPIGTGSVDTKEDHNSEQKPTADGNAVLPIIAMMTLAAGSLLKVTRKQRNN